MSGGGVPETKSVMVLGGEIDVRHTCRFGEAANGIGVKLIGGKAVLQGFIGAKRDWGGEANPFRAFMGKGYLWPLTS